MTAIQTYKVKREGLLFCLIGPAGGGKTTVGQRLLSDNPDSLGISVSMTSRAARADEIAGQSYHFVTREEFEVKINADQFFEWEEVHGQLYGTLRTNLEGCIESGRDLLLIIDIKGALNIKKYYPRNTVICFITPPSMSVLKERLRMRGSISEEEYERRVRTSESEFAKLNHLQSDNFAVDYLVINEDLAKACMQVGTILAAERNRFLRYNRQFVEDVTRVKI